MKTMKHFTDHKTSAVTIDPSLEKQQGQILFPKKLEMANEMLKNAKLPPNKNRR